MPDVISLSIVATERNQKIPPIDFDLVEEEDTQLPAISYGRAWLKKHRQTFTVYGFSTLFHAILLMLLAMIVFHIQRYDSALLDSISTRIGEEETVDEGYTFVAKPIDDIGKTGDPSATILPKASTTQVSANSTSTSAKMDVPLPDAEREVARVTDDFAQKRLEAQFSGRTAAARAALVQEHGGTAKSEAAVNRGLKWLATHQNEDGGWSFDHFTEACEGSCLGPGEIENCRLGATSLALLAFLGAGHTHQAGDYQTLVNNGLEFLLENLVLESKGADLRGDPLEEAAMYVQGMATIVLCEGYAMTSDRRLREPAQSAIDFIVWAQDPEGGGWRYRPQQTGDTSVLGWQVMALTSARIAGLKVPDETLYRAKRFLKSVRSTRGQGYGYVGRQRRATTTAVGLLSLMYLDPSRTQASFRSGAKYLHALRPSRLDMYYNYYATQFMHHYSGPMWSNWNELMREWLVATQERNGHAEGSWAPRDRFGEIGGRLYMTCMAVLTLEVYYRHLPLYKHATKTAGL